MSASRTAISPAQRYIELLKHTLTFTLWPEPLRPIEYLNENRSPIRRTAVALIASALRLTGYQLARATSVTFENRRDGDIWPYYADTLLGLNRLDHLQRCIETVLQEGVPGDLIEAGVWRGGGSIFMRGVLAAYDVNDRIVYAADSFRGFPPAMAAPDIKLPFARDSYMAVSAETVRENFRRYGLLDNQVVLLEGWFKDTLPRSPIERLAVVRLDADMYESVMDALEALHPRLSPGGFCIVDNYRHVDTCNQAVTDYRAAHGITTEIQSVDANGVFWRTAR